MTDTALSPAEYLEAVTEFAAAAEHFEQATLAATDGLPIRDLAAAAWRVKAIAARFGDVASELDRRLADVLPWGEDVDLGVEGVPPMRRKGKGGGWTWDHEAAAATVAARIADTAFDHIKDEPVPPGVLCQRVAAALVTCGAVNYWRLEKSEDTYGIDMTEFRDRKRSSGSTVEWKGGTK